MFMVSQMICSNCQHQNSPDARFCINCGAQQVNLCTKCGTENEINSKFCKHCGNELKSDSHQETKKSRFRPKEAERRQLTCVFCDLVGSTPLSERLDAEDYRQVILDYQQIAGQVIKQHGGHVAQYLGDGLLVYFGYPKGLEDAPKAAIRAGLGILEAVDAANQEWREAGRIEIDIRIGIHSGLVVVDDHLAMGDTVNITARLEGLAPINGLVISSKTFKLVQGWFQTTSLGKKFLKGIKKPMEIFQVLAESGVQTRLEVSMGRGLSPLVGRDEEFQILKRTWNLAKGGRGQLILLSGEAGIGKSRLAASLKEQVKQEPNTIRLEMRCSDHHVNSPFYALIDLMKRRILDFTKAEAPESKLHKLVEWLELAGIEKKHNLPIYADFLSIPLNDDLRRKYESILLAPAGKKKKFQDGFTRAIFNYAARQPLLLVIEDLHWMDISTLEWLESVIPQMHPHAVCILCTARPLFQPNWQTKSHITQLNLHGLTSEKIETICYHQTKGKQLPKEVLKQIKAKTDGVPLFIEELTRMLIESNLLVEEASSYRLEGNLTDLSIPSTLQDSLTARLDQLAEVKDIAQVGSVLGRSFSYELLKAVTRKDERGMKEDLSRLIEAELLYQRGIAPDCTYIFKHALVQDAAYGSLLKKRRQELHEDVAEVLQSQFQEQIKSQPEVLANHLTEARQYQIALMKWEEAGRLAISNNANQEAVPHFEKALSLLKHIPDIAKRDSKELDLLLPYNSALMATRGWYHPTLEETVQRIINLSEKEQNDEKYLFALIGLISSTWVKGNILDAQVLAQKGMKRARLIKNDKYFIFFHTFSGVADHARGNFKRSFSTCKSILSTYKPELHEDITSFGAGEIGVWATIHFVWDLLLMGYPDQARSKLQDLPTASEKPDDMGTLYRRHVDKGVAHYILKEWDLAFEEVQSFLVIVEESGDSLFLMLASLFFQYFSSFSGKSSNGMEKVVSILKQFEQMGFLIWAPIFYNLAAEVFFREMDYEKAKYHNEKAAKFADRTKEEWWLSAVYKLQGEILLANGKAEQEAENQFLQAIQLAQQQSARWHELQATISLARLWKTQHKTEEAHALLNGIYSWFTEGFDTVDMLEAKELLDELRA